MLDKFKMVTDVMKSMTGEEINLADSETSPSANDGFHRFMNRASRVPRLALLIMVIGLFIWPAFAPEHFTAWIIAIKEIPENMWILIFTIVGSWATTKFIRDVRRR